MSAFDKTKIIEKLLDDIEEEEICMSLLNTHYQDVEELRFFEPEKREKIVHVLQRLAEDSKRHKQMIIKVIEMLEKVKTWNTNS